MLVQLVKDLSQMSLMLFCVVAINEYIVQIDKNKVKNVTRHHSIHWMLERSRPDSKAVSKVGYSKLILTFRIPNILSIILKLKLTSLK